MGERLGRSEMGVDTSGMGGAVASALGSDTLPSATLDKGLNALQQVVLLRDRNVVMIGNHHTLTMHNVCVAEFAGDPVRHVAHRRLASEIRAHDWACLDVTRFEICLELFS